MAPSDFDRIIGIPPYMGIPPYIGILPNGGTLSAIPQSRQLILTALHRDTALSRDTALLRDPSYCCNRKRTEESKWRRVSVPGSNTIAKKKAKTKKTETTNLTRTRDRKRKQKNETFGSGRIHTSDRLSLSILSIPTLA